MIHSIIAFSVKNKLVIGLLVIGLIVAGIVSLQRLPIDAVPDITNNQVQVVTVSTSLAAQEIEQFITYPVEVAVANIPNVIEIRSISRFGLSVVTIVFADHVPILEARQYVKEQISLAAEEIPAGLGSPELMPITTGLGEIYQYILEVKPGYEHQYDPMKLRTIQDWIVKRQLAGIKGIIEISSFGGYLKQYEVAVDPLKLRSQGLTLSDIFETLEKNNQNSGGSYIEKATNAYYIRTEGLVQSTDEIELIPVATRNGIPVLIKDVAEVRFGSPKRFGAMTMDGKGEAVGGITLMLKGGNSSEAIRNVQERIEEVKKSLPEGIRLYPYLDRSVLVGKTIETVKRNLLEGGAIVILVLILLLGNLRAGLIVASVIPLSMLFALILMNLFNVSANLMSLGAIDFGIVIDGAVIVVEGVLSTLVAYHAGKQLQQKEMDRIITESSANLFQSAIFGVFIILVVFIPIITLTGIEGKMFRPMAMTFSFAVLGALLLSLTYVPMISSLFLSKNIKEEKGISERIIGFLKRLYHPTLKAVLRIPYLVLTLALALFLSAFLLFRSMGAEFIPTLEEGDLAMQMAIQPGSSLQESIKTATKAEKILLKHFPEVRHVVSKIGTAEVPTDPMAIEDADIMIILKEKEEWTSAKTREGLADKMKEKLEVIAGASFEFTQPIQLRFNELMTGAKADIAVKIYGENTEMLKKLADEAARIIEEIPGAGDVKVDQTEGLPQLMIRYDRGKIAEHGVNISEMNRLIRTAYAGETTGVVFEDERKFDLVVRLAEDYRQDLRLDQMFINNTFGRPVPLSELARVEYTEGPMQISRENARRRITIGINVRGRDVASLVEEVSGALDSRLSIPPGYTIRYGGQFENLRAAQQRLSVAVPLALALIFVLLYFTFGKLKYALVIFSAVPLSAIGGVVALWLRGMPFSISAGVGFIALFGVAVLNGIVLISYFNRLKKEQGVQNLKELVILGGLGRLRPVVMTATVAAFGFLPMALSTSNGAEVQKPLATVVIGGLITATLLTLIVLPALYYLVNRKTEKNLQPPAGKGLTTILLLFLGMQLSAQTPGNLESILQHAFANHPQLQNQQIRVQQAQLEGVGIYALPPTEFDLQSGQINTAIWDFNLSATQPLGNRPAMRQREKLAKASLEQAESQLILSQKELRLQISQDWQDWIYQDRLLSLLQAQQNLYDSLVTKTRLRLSAGSSDQLSLLLAENQQIQNRQQLKNIQLQVISARRRLIRSAFLDTLPEKPDIPLEEALPLPEELVLDSSLYLPYEKALDVAEQEWRLQQKQTQPEFTVGYFAQSIRPDIPFQGVAVGMRVPLWKKGLKAKIEQSELQGQVAINQLNLKRHQLKQESALSEDRLLQLYERLQSSGPIWQEQARQLRQLAALQLQQGAIDFFRYAQALQLALENEIAYYELLNQYNQTVLYHRYLTTKE
jgi:cobalt-zinc-cadmium resistance protein CzcA